MKTTCNTEREEVERLYRLIGQNVARMRKERGMTQLDLTLAMGYKSVGLVSQAELCLNQKHFNIEHLYKISKVLEVEMGEFFKGMEEV